MDYPWVGYTVIEITKMITTEEEIGSARPSPTTSDGPVFSSTTTGEAEPPMPMGGFNSFNSSNSFSFLAKFNKLNCLRKGYGRIDLIILVCFVCLGV